LLDSLLQETESKIITKWLEKQLTDLMEFC